jgi:hypothetical protein
MGVKEKLLPKKAGSIAKKAGSIAKKTRSIAKKAADSGGSWLAYLATLGGKGGYEHIKTATSAEGISFKAAMKENDECSWALDPEGKGLHCAVTGRSTYIKAITWLILIVMLANVVKIMYTQKLFDKIKDAIDKKEVENETLESGYYDLIITNSVFTLIIFLYLLHISGIKKRYLHYGKVSWLWGTKNRLNADASTSQNIDIERGPAWKPAHEIEYTTDVDQQVIDIRKAMKLNKGNQKKLKKDLIGVQKIQTSELRDQIGPSKYSKRGNCDICANITGDSEGNGQCTTYGRCILATIVFSIFTIFFIAMFIMLVIEEEEDENDTFRQVMLGANGIMAFMCAVSIPAMIWSALYCPSGSEFTMLGMLGFESSYRW